MSHYKTLNKELVEQVQTMRKNIKLFCDEIVHLKEELLQKHEAEVILRKQCFTLAVNNFAQLAQFLQPDSEILPILKEHLHENTYSFTPFTTHGRVSCISRSSGERSASSHNRSSLLTLELQRSNSLINLRKSVRNSSPVRRISEDDVNEENLSSEQDIDARKQLSQTDLLADNLNNPDISRTIYEETEEEDQIECDIYDVDEIMDSPPINTLKDVTNTFTSSNNVTKDENAQGKIIRKVGRSKKSKNPNLGDKEKTNVYSNSMELSLNSDVYQIRSRKKLSENLTERSVVDTEEETLQVARRCSNDRSAWQLKKSFCINQDDSRVEVRLSSPASIYTSITLRNFEDAAACSTPNSKQNSLSKTKTPTMTSESETEFPLEALSSTSGSTRPSRKCKPKCLVETSKKTKLRNESDVQVKAIPRKKSKSKNRK